MKKRLLFFSLLVYFVVSTGFVVSVHYCMDQFQSLQLGDSKHDDCPVCGMPIKQGRGCCKDEVKVVKLQVDQTTAKISTPDFALPAVPTPLTSYVISPVVVELKPATPIANGPPINEQDLYLRNRVFRI